VGRGGWRRAGLAVDHRAGQRQQALAESGQAGASGAPLQAGGQSQMKVVVNPALKALVLSGTSEQVREALELIARLDVPPEPFDGQASVIPLKNVLAEDLQRTLNEFVAEDQRADQQAQAGAPGAGATRRPDADLPPTLFSSTISRHHLDLPWLDFSFFMPQKDHKLRTPPWKILHPQMLAQVIAIRGHLMVSDCLSHRSLIAI
jgi:hypothetical protein